MNTRTTFDNLLVGLIPVLLIALVLLTQVQPADSTLMFISGIVTGMTIAIAGVVVWRLSSTSPSPKA